MTLRIGYLFVVALLCTTVGANRASAQLREKKTIGLEAARKMAAAAEAEAVRRKASIVVAIADDGGHLVFLERMDGTQYGIMDATIEKTRTSSGFPESTRFFENQIARGGEGLAFLSMPNLAAKAGGFPVVVNGEQVGSLAVGGGMDEIDDACARAALAAISAEWPEK